MSLLVYCSYPILDQGFEPEWVNRLDSCLKLNNLSSFSLYRPWFPVQKQPHIFDLLLSNPHPFFVENRNTLNIPDIVLEPFDSPSVQRFFEKFDHPEPNNMLPYRDMYCLVRSHILIADLSLPSYGETFHDVFFAKMAKIPMIGLSTRFLNSPIMMNYVDVFTSSEKLDVIVRQLVNYSMGYSQISKSEPPADSTVPPEAENLKDADRAQSDSSAQPSGQL